MENNNTSLPYNKTSPEKGKLSLDKHLEEIGDNVTNGFKKPLFKGSLDKYIDDNNIDISNSDTIHKNKSYKDSTIEISEEEFERLAKQNDSLAIDIDEPLKEIEYLLTDRNGVGTLPLGNLSMIVAPPKNAKSTTVGIFVAAILGYAKKYYLHAPIKGTTVLHIDTEQHREDQKRGFHYIYDMCKEYKMSKQDFRQSYRPLHLRSISGEELQKSAIVDIIRFKPKFVVLDGIAQMQNDLLDQSESAKLVSLLLRICEKFNCNIMCVIHTTKLKYNEKDMSNFLPKGATGTWLNQAVADAFVCVLENPEATEKDRHFLCRHIISRHRHIADIKFYRDQKGMPHPYFDITVITDEDRVSQAILKLLSENGNKGIIKGELMKQLEKTLGKGYGRATLENKWDKLTAPIKEQLLEIPQGAAKLIRLKDPNDPEQMNLDLIAEPNQQTDEAPF